MQSKGDHNRRVHRIIVGIASVFLVASLISWTTAPDVIVASKAFPESRLLAEIMAQLIEARTDLRVGRKLGLGGTMVCFEAIRTGSIDVYPEYTGTGLLSILNLELGDDRTSDAIYQRVSEAFSRNYDLEVLGRFGFNNSYVLAARSELGLSKISDLSAVEDTVRARFHHEFLDRADGYPGLQSAYGLDLKDVQGMEHGLAYVAMSKDQIDLMDAYATDGMLAEFEKDISLLEDDFNFFPPYDAVPLVRQKTLQRHPVVEDVLLQLEGMISRQQMTAMNYGVVQQDWIPEIASRFLLEQGLIGQNSVVEKSWWYDVSHFIEMLLQHLFLTFTATSLATVVGIGLGLLVAKHEEILSGPVMGAVGIIQTIPSLALLAFLIPFTSIGMTPAIIALFLYGLLPIVRNTYTGIASVPAELKDAGMGMGMTPRQLLLQLEFPLAIRTIMAGVRTALVINVGTATLGAFIGAGGFGDPIYSGLQQMDNGQILLGAISAASLALICDFSMAQVERRLGPKGMDAK